MSNGRDLWLSSMTGLIVSLVTAMGIILIGFVLMLYFQGNAYPTDIMYGVDAKRWGQEFFTWLFWATLISFVFNFLIVIFAMYCGAFFRSSMAWTIYLFISIIIGVVFSIVFRGYYPEETSCSIIAFAVFILGQIIEFVLSTVFCSKIWRSDFVPFC